MENKTIYIADYDHYTKVLEKVGKVKGYLWIATADIKDLHVKTGTGQIPFLGVIAGLIRKGVQVRLMHAKEPGPLFREDFDRYPVLADRLERVLCPRIHFKMMIFDFKEAYIGSARNFEAGILTDDLSLVDAAAEHFDSVWRGEKCKACGKRQFCGDPII